MTDLARALVDALDDDALDALADLLAPRIAARAAALPARLLTPREAATQLGLHVKTVQRMAADGRLVAVKVGTGWRFPADQLGPPLPVTARQGPPPAATGRGFPSMTAAQATQKMRDIARAGQRESAAVIAIRGGGR